MIDKQKELNDLESALTALANSKPYQPSRFVGREQRNIEQVSNFALSVVLGLCLAIVLLILVKLFVADFPWLRTAALLIAVAIQLTGIFIFIVRALGSILLATRWKQIALTTMLNEVKTNEANADKLASYRPEILKRAAQHLRMKLLSVERRAGAILGDKTAVISAIALSLPIVKEAGGLSSLSRAFDSSTDWMSWETFLMYFFALLLGLSLGAIGLKFFGERIRYQLDILALVESKITR